MWQVFNNIGDGFGVRADELEEICIDLKDELNISQISMMEKIKTLFVTFDTDNNGLIDALEFFSSISVLSGMKKRAIMEFILTIYDFDGTEVRYEPTCAVNSSVVFGVLLQLALVCLVV
jgi:Ca2+-binding EF-hand superfamily protein